DPRNPRRLLPTNQRLTTLSMDVIHVGGGDTANMLDVWRRQGVDLLLREAWENGAVMTGGSAGAICWFQGGTTDSFGPILQILPEGLGLLAGSCCPHYDAEDQRQPLFHRAIRDGELPDGYAIDDLVSLHFHGTDLIDAVSSQADGRARRVLADGDRVIETPIPVRHLVSTGGPGTGPRA
ncbi:hypothetical protein GL305_06410, partial [Nocardia seriolae]|nr:hypothetical protein [Nocardia seriolae]MTJ85665.1 hypothetical protein [Nocardia seriolae]MTK29662.1 hypothetical protein [Nocardia seriolae]MTK46229.1 hypothetical protein [Nocardia seriolae]MTL11263.1 hypothetical protein [Nocardia seriolae]